MINAYCFCVGDTTWAIHATNFLRALSRRHEVALVPLDADDRPRTLPDDMQRMIANGRTPDPRAPAIGIGPIEAMKKLHGSKRIAFVAWETTKMPRAKVDILKSVDEVWTPSEWGRRMLIENGLDPTRTRVVPEGVDVERFRPRDRSAAASRFRFLCVGKWEARKGIDDLVRAWCDEFGAEEPVELVLHCANPWMPRFDLDAQIRRAARAPHAPIIAGTPVPGDAMADLYRGADAFVLPTRGEGWGLPIMEAMACGLPVIATGYSAMQDYLHDGIAYPIRVKTLVDVHDPFFFPEGAAVLGQWAQPDLLHLRALMRHVFEHPDEAAQKGRRAREEVCARWTWDHAAAKACDLVAEPRASSVSEAERHRAMLEEILETDSEPPHRFTGPGIVICAGGNTYFPCAWVCIRMLRELGCTLPIELWYRGAREMTPAMVALIERHDVRCIDAYEVARRVPYRRLDSWEIKPFAIAYSAFAEVLYIDADNVPLRDPSFLLATAEYADKGALFWPDRYAGPGTGTEWLKREAWQVCGVPHRVEPEIEAGQLVIDKRRCWKPLRMTLHLNEHSDYYYAFFYGDKDTFHLAWRRTGTEYALVPHPPRTLGHSQAMAQFDFEGSPLFHHRGGAKWSLTRPNPSIHGFAHEERCIRFLDELRAEWTPAVVPMTSNERVASDAICAVRRFDYSLHGAGRRILELRPDFTVGEGRAEMEMAWAVEEDKDGEIVLTIRNANGPTCFLRRGDDGVWRGRWRVYHRALVELRPA